MTSTSDRYEDDAGSIDVPCDYCRLENITPNVSDPLCHKLAGSNTNVTELNSHMQLSL